MEKEGHVDRFVEKIGGMRATHTLPPRIKLNGGERKGRRIRSQERGKERTLFAGTLSSFYARKDRVRKQSYGEERRGMGPRKVWVAKKCRNKLLSSKLKAHKWGGGVIVGKNLVQQAQPTRKTWS